VTIIAQLQVFHFSQIKHWKNTAHSLVTMKKANISAVNTHKLMLLHSAETNAAMTSSQEMT
jgi:hypothetical protein